MVRKDGQARWGNKGCECRLKGWPTFGEGQVQQFYSRDKNPGLASTLGDFPAGVLVSAMMISPLREDKSTAAVIFFRKLFPGDPKGRHKCAVSR